MRVSSIIFGAVAAMTVICTTGGCALSSKAPIAVSKSTYTGLSQSEQQLLPKEINLMTLDLAQDIAVQNNPSFKSAYYAIVAARAAYYQVFSGYLPTISLTYDLGQNLARSSSQDAGGHVRQSYSTPGANAQLLVFDSLVREMTLIAARHNWKQSEAAERDAHRLLLRSVAYAYNDVMLAAAKINIAKADMEYNVKLLEETELKFYAGASPLSDVLNFKVRYNNAESSLYDSQFSLAYSKYILATLLGLTEANIPDSVSFPEMPSPDGEILSEIGFYLDTALINRPDLKQYREALEVSKYSYYASIASFGPKVGAFANINYDAKSYGYSSYGATAGYTITPNTWNIGYGIAASWEVFSGGKTYFAMRQAQAQVAASDYQLANTWITVIAEVRVAYDNYITSLKKVKLSQKNLEIVRKTRDLVNREYKAGSTGITRVNEAQRDFVSAEASLATAVIDLHNAKAQLSAATNSI